MSGGGSGGSGTQQYNWNDDMAPLWKSALQAAQNNAGTPYQAYPGQRIAGINGDEQNAMNNIRAYASDPTLGVGDPNKAQNAGIAQETSTLNGNYLNSDPYSGKQNVYEGMSSPYFQSALQNGMGDITQAYQQGTAADTTRMFNQAGAFGGSAYQNAVGMNQNALAKQLGNYASGMQNDQYNRSAQLEQQGQQLGSQAYQDERNRQMQAIGSAQNEQGLALQRGNALMGVGDVQRSYGQDQLNQAYNDYQTQKQYPYSQLDYLTGIYSRAMGGMSPNVTTTQNAYNGSPFSSLLGGALVGSSLLGGH